VAKRYFQPAPFDPFKFEEAIPDKGWPAGISQSDFHFAGEPVRGNDADDVANTMLGKLLNELEEGTARVRRV
jgi:hypothetical protein